MFRREPVVIATASIAVVQGVLIFVNNDTLAQVPVWVMPLLTMLISFVRQLVMPIKTIKDAGISVRGIKEQAANSN